MLFVINNLKYDTDKMELISKKCKWKHKGSLLEGPYNFVCDVNIKLYRSIHNRWLIVYNYRANRHAIAISEEMASNLLMNYDVEKYEQLFGELEYS